MARINVRETLIRAFQKAANYAMLPNDHHPANHAGGSLSFNWLELIGEKTRQTMCVIVSVIEVLARHCSRH